MATQITVPTLGESVSEATVAKWFKAVGDAVAADEPLLELETDKVTLEVNSPAGGTLTEIAVPEGSDVEVGALLGMIAEGASAPAAKAKPAPAPAKSEPAAIPLSPAVRKLVDEQGLDAQAISGTGKDGRLTKGDVLAHIEAQTAPAPAPAQAPKPAPAPAPAPAAAAATPWSGDAMFPPRPDGPREERVRMTRLRKKIAEHLKNSQNTAATLTTYNEADMSAVMALRAEFRDAFEKKHGIRLGFMSFFVKACVTALREFPVVNAAIEGDEIVYKNHYDIGVAVGLKEGLVVPVVRNADALSFAAVEGTIGELAKKARDGSLGMDELEGGTFTISNAGVYGSLNSMPILNLPQSAVLGMHKIQQRPVVAEDGSIVARPMMYLALSYDHRLIDGRQAVSFLVRVKKCIENPTRIMLDT
ncbi:MAG: 2-oxoglutarate dehydrogenase complex dihydrolipoyllysine-residue succinyltransferase [Rhodospirillales bacterium]|jgi:2-oxoglutarate dehydrogenase E2 component (dihydrolipoamide succinyltransferase)|nr:2-oxoglutarate dehydrogenase complex dihydrolipoyllysine-residue succinyltransferase [Rhodospirillales bacterium]